MATALAGLEGTMYIVSMRGEILAEFDRWDIRSVAKAEAWIRDHGAVLFKCETLITGAFVMTVKI